MANVFDFAYNLGASPKVNVDHPLPDMAMPRIPYEVLFVFGGGEGQDFVNEVETYNTRTDQWTKVLKSVHRSVKSGNFKQTAFLRLKIKSANGLRDVSFCSGFMDIDLFEDILVLT